MEIPTQKKKHDFLLSTRTPASGLSDSDSDDGQSHDAGGGGEETFPKFRQTFSWKALSTEQCIHLAGSSDDPLEMELMTAFEDGVACHQL